uniref:hypothetical protein n=1 Tax=Listeria ivanovii TaxID=1638 RepID=UPI0018ED93CC|nr:hypothetical protein [Listeria ivanovii]
MVHHQTSFHSKKQKEMLYYVTLLDCTECCFETTIYTSFKEAEAYFKMVGIR